MVPMKVVKTALARAVQMVELSDWSLASKLEMMMARMTDYEKVDSSVE